MKREESYNCFAFFHQNEALLYQFFLDECLTSSQQLMHKLSPQTLEKLLGPSPCMYCYQAKGNLPRMFHLCSLYKEHFGTTSILEKIEESLICAQKHACDQNHQHLKREIKKIGDLLLEKFYLYNENPHVLYFVLRNYNQLKKHYSKLPNLETYRDFLSEKMAQKGFHHLLPGIEKLMAEISNV